MATKFGKKAVKYKWFTIFYIVASFFLLPLTFYGICHSRKSESSPKPRYTINVILLIILGLSLVDTILMEIISGIVLFIIFFVISVNYMQEHHENMLPWVLRDWTFLPKPLRTLETIDYVVQTYMEVGIK